MPIKEMFEVKTGDGVEDAAFWSTGSGGLCMCVCVRVFLYCNQVLSNIFFYETS
jgi:hypothetical protein